MDKFCLGIIGRCLSFQPWINISDLYHRRLREMLEKQDKIVMRVSIAPRSDLLPYERMKILYKKKKLNGVLYHMRNIGNQPFIDFDIDNFGKRKYFINPYIFKWSKEEIKYKNCDAVQIALSIRKKKDDHDLFDIPPQNSDNIGQRNFLGIPFRKINLLVAKLCGLQKRAMINEYNYLERVRKLCLELNIPLFVLGSIPSIEILKTRRKLFKKMQKYTEKKLSKHEIPSYFFQSIYDEKGRSLYKKDQMHLTLEGHSFLAKELYPIMSIWMKLILKNEI